MCLYPVSDPDNNFFVKPTRVTADVNVFLFIGLKHGDELVTFEYLIFAFFFSVINDLKIKHFFGSGYAYVELFHR
jgi:hypothetical protein